MNQPADGRALPATEVLIPDDLMPAFEEWLAEQGGTLFKIPVDREPCDPHTYAVVLTGPTAALVAPVLLPDSVDSMTEPAVGT